MLNEQNQDLDLHPGFQEQIFRDGL